jgi:hypothetical protein
VFGCSSGRCAEASTRGEPQWRRGAGLMKVYEVSRAVNGVKNDTPECVGPVGK